MIIAIVVLVIACLVLSCLLFVKKKKDIETEKYNKQLNDKRNRLLLECNDLQIKCKHTKEQIDENNQAIKDKIELGKQLDEKLDNQRESLNQAIESNKEISTKAFENYCKILEEEYEKQDKLYDAKMNKLNYNVEVTKEELEKLKQTLAAAHESILKAQEVKDNKDNYRLLPSQSDLTDARRLEIVKRELNKPRILSMLIWQTYWQPLAKKQFPLILQAKTKCGIYKITNLITDECYIGQSVDIYTRWNQHCKCGLGIDTPPGNKLYKSMQEYGLDNFTFELVEECQQSELNEKEKYFISLYQADTYGYNSNIGVSK